MKGKAIWVCKFSEIRPQSCKCMHTSNNGNIELSKTKITILERITHKNKIYWLIKCNQSNRLKISLVLRVRALNHVPK